jgi:hypothetical protein
VRGVVRDERGGVRELRDLSATTSASASLSLHFFLLLPYLSGPPDPCPDLTADCPLPAPPPTT